MVYIKSNGLIGKVIDGRDGHLLVEAEGDFYSVLESDVVEIVEGDDVTVTEFANAFGVTKTQARTRLRKMVKAGHMEENIVVRSDRFIPHYFKLV